QRDLRGTKRSPGVRCLMSSASCRTTPSVFFFQAEDGIRDGHVTGVQTCALPISETELTGFKIEQLEETDAHIRSTIVVVDGNKRVVGFIPHPEFIQGIVIVRG